jgi:5-oxoprolinase (ATP-hydrolysing)
VLIDNELLVDEGHFREAEMRALLGSGEWPARNPDRNISDLKAQLAACTRGAEVLAQTARDYGPEVVAAYMNHVLANAEESVRRCSTGSTTASSIMRWTMARVVR